MLTKRNYVNNEGTMNLASITNIVAVRAFKIYLYELI